MDGSAGRSQISIRLPTDLLEECDRIAAALDRDRTWIVKRALRQYFDGEGADILKEAAGLASLDRNEGVDFDTVQAEVDAIIANARGKT
jgi:predicted transcriptional regulator